MVFIKSWDAFISREGCFDLVIRQPGSHFCRVGLHRVCIEIGSQTSKAWCNKHRCHKHGHLAVRSMIHHSVQVEPEAWRHKNSHRFFAWSGKKVQFELPDFFPKCQVIKTVQKFTSDSGIQSLSPLLLLRHGTNEETLQIELQQIEGLWGEAGFLYIMQLKSKNTIHYERGQVSLQT